MPDQSARSRSGRRSQGLAIAASALILSALAGGWLPAAADAQSDCRVPAKLGMAFSIDDSGSMASSDPALLRAAATGVGIDQLPEQALAAASTFADDARSVFEPVEIRAGNRGSLKDRVEASLDSSGGTDYELGLLDARRQLDAMAAADKRALIFLSDGEPNDGSYLDEVEGFRAAGIPIFTVGFGSAPGAVLAEMAAETRGQAYTVQSPGEAQAVFARIISTLNCDAAQLRDDVVLAPGESRAFPFTINPTDREFRALAAWSDGDIQVGLRRPDGSVLSPGAEHAGESFISEPTYASVTGTNPAPGGWSLVVTAASGNTDAVNVSIDVFRRTSADPPDAFALGAPNAGAQLTGGSVTFTWSGARNAQGYEVEIDDRVVTAVARDATSATVAVGPGTHSWRIFAINQFGRTPSERRTFTMTGPPPVVFVAGLNENTAAVHPRTACSLASDFALLCQRLRLAGFPVYVIESSGNGAAPGLDSKGDINENARRLGVRVRDVIREERTPPLLVGHSMGGLIARVAISRYGVPAAGLFTIGTPHSGSLFADMLAGARVAFCGVCGGLNASAAVIRQEVGPAAVDGLTAVARTADNLTLRPTGVPTWVYAGTILTNLLNFDPTGYVYPQDGAVGRGSAWGRLANLGPRQQLQKPLWHARTLPVVNTRTIPNEFEDADVGDQVVAAARSLRPPSGSRAASRSVGMGRSFGSASSGGGRPPRQSPRRRVRVSLTTARSRRVRSGRSTPAGAAAQVYGSRPFDLVCRGTRVPATQLGPTLYGALPGHLSCPGLAIRSSRAGRLVIVASRRDGVRATATRRSGVAVIELRGASRLRSVRVRVGGRTRRLRGGRRVVRTRIRQARRGATVTVRATAGGRVYTGGLRLP